jgi:hypothetical protein
MKCLRIHTIEKGWCDRDHVLLHAAFQVLVDFIEKEKPNKTIDWKWNKKHQKAWKEMSDLYYWWTKERPKRKSHINDEKLKIPPLKFINVPGSKYKTLDKPNKKKYAKYYKALKIDWKLERKWHKEDTKNLHRLVNIRDFLWT